MLDGQLDHKLVTCRKLNIISQFSRLVFWMIRGPNVKSPVKSTQISSSSLIGVTFRDFPKVKKRKVNVIGLYTSVLPSLTESLSELTSLHIVMMKNKISWLDQSHQTLSKRASIVIGIYFTRSTARQVPRRMDQFQWSILIYCASSSLHYLK